jgi:carotenoid cleavage dioxygenase-like enzyme
MNLTNIFKRLWKWIKSLFKGDPLPHQIVKPKNKALLGTSRNEVDVALNIIEGEIPDGLTGVFYAMTQVGSVNSGGLPFPEYNSDGSYNHEYGSPMMNGDGMCMAVYFNEDGPRAKTSIMKTPCYYADEATKWGTEHHSILGFKNFGITRMSLALGGRNELNTAVVPVKFNYQDEPALLATYDVGRPFAFDPVSLDLQTPVGKNTNWKTAEPAQVPWPFGIVQTSAHPMFDPITAEFFTVNYVRDSGSNVLQEKTLHHKKHNPIKFKEKLEALADELHGHHDRSHVQQRVQDFFHNLDAEITGKGHKVNPMQGDCEVYLWRWDGEKEPHQWLLHDQNGNLLEIKECMHQLGITENHIILTDCSFKFSIDLLVSNPFPESQKIDEFVRWMLAYPMVPNTKTYLVKRSDLDLKSNVATAVMLDKEIPAETIHYSCDYAEKDGKIKLYGMHNTAVCMAEWLRPYDINKLTGQPIDPEVVSLFAIGSMDLSRIGKWVMDAENGKLLEDESKVFCEPGDVNGKLLGPNTWSLSLNTHRGLNDALEVNREIKWMWYIATGTDERALSNFIYDMYEEYEHRIYPVEDVLEATRKNLPFTLIRLNTEDWEADQVYQADPLTYFRSIQFIPKSPATPGVDPQLDGFVMVTVQVGEGTQENATYTSQFWVFDAQDIEKGPLVKLQNDALQFCFSLHSAWIPKAAPSTWKYNIDIEEDYNEVIEKCMDKEFIQQFFDDNVYPHFK